MTRQLLAILAAAARFALVDAQDLFVDGNFNNNSGPNAPVAAITLQSDGKILIGGDFTQIDGLNINRLARLNTDGSVDASFQIAAGFDRHVSNVLIDSTGKIIVAGDFNSLAPQLVRLTPAGAVDSSFAWQGRLNGRVTSASLQSDGKIVIGGDFESLDGNPRAFLIRVSTNGSLDTSFQAAIHPTDAMESGVDVLAIQSDGKILVGGTFDASGQSSSLVRLNTDGSLDATFAGAVGPMLYLSSLVIDSRGDILAGGLASPGGAGFIRRLLPDRSIDTAFRQDIAINGFVRAVALLPDARLMIAGSFSTLDGISSLGLARLNSDGTADSAFQLNAVGVTALAVQPDGAVLLAGSFDQINGVPRHNLARLRPAANLTATSTKVKGGPITLTWKTISGQNYRIDASTDLINWSSVGTITASGDRIDYIESDSTLAPKRFFRLIPQ